MSNAVVVEYCRTPIGRSPGKLSGLSEVELLGLCFAEVVKRSKIDPNLIEYAIAGCAFPMERTNLCRKAILKAQLPESIPGTNIIKTCTSSMEALAQATNMIRANVADVILVGGVESMSNSPYVLSYLKKMIKITNNGNLPSYDEVKQNINEDDMQLISEMLARKYSISRETLDNYAIDSYQKAIVAQKNGYFTKEIFPVQIEENNSKTTFFKDEGIPEEFNFSDISSKAPFYITDGILTNYNSAPIGDASTAVILMSRKKANELGLKIYAEIIENECIGIPRNRIGLGSVDIIQSILNRARLKINDINLWECIEVPSVQSILCEKILKINPEKINVNGGCIALGHPVGSSGLRICITLINEMNRRKIKYGLAAGSAGGGIGQAILIKNINPN